MVIKPTKQTKRRLTYTNVVDFVRQCEIKSYTELLATAQKRKLEGENNIAEFVLSHNEKNIRELVTKTRLMKSATAKL